MAKVTSKQIDQNIALFTTNRDLLRQLAHDTAMMILHHAAPKTVNDDCSGSGDTTRALKLIKAMPKSWAEQMNVWFNTFSPIRVVHQRDTHGLCVKYKALVKDGMTPEEKKAGLLAKDAHWKLAEAIETPFWLLSKEKDVVSMDIAKITGWNMAQAKAWEKRLKDDEDAVKENPNAVRKIAVEAIPATLALIAALKSMSIKVAVEEPANGDEAEPLTKTA